VDPVHHSAGASAYLLASNAVPDYVGQELKKARGTDAGLW